MPFKQWVWSSNLQRVTTSEQRILCFGVFSFCGPQSIVLAMKLRGKIRCKVCEIDFVSEAMLPMTGTRFASFFALEKMTWKIYRISACF